MWDFWDEYIWLGENTSWTDMANANISYPQVTDLRYTVVFGFALLITRVLLESFVFLPIGWIGGWISSPLLPQIWSHIFGGFAGRSKFKRVAACAWRLCFYVCVWTAGLVVLMREPQLMDVTECWRGWPHHNITNAVWWYYILEASFYWALLIGTLCIDVRRADFLQMLVHHVIAILLLYISWSANMVRVGTLILFTHDAADILLEAMRMARYAMWLKLRDIIFLIFFTVWTATRLVYYPFWILRSVLFDAPELLQPSYRWTSLWQRPLAPKLVLMLLSSLFVFHVFWTYVIMKATHKSVRNKKLGIREESDSEDDEKAKDK
ncbi:unnamed protein product [Cylicocyclus nassatus]|uniref:TLC domain-containing protein n=1 Tax=Cylicocyclus nassatus TaxID=53992 RepID=A0AA36ME99_CYLNA|nr:unnamed protein product [Cylicocyclus nassatus]